MDNKKLPRLFNFILLDPAHGLPVVQQLCDGQHGVHGVTRLFERLLFFLRKQIRIKQILRAACRTFGSNQILL